MSTAEIATTSATGVMFYEDREQIELLKRTICKDATDDEFRMFLGICKRRRLDPFAKQIYFRKYKGYNGKPDQVTIITGIDAYRLTAQRTGEYEGQAGPQWCGPDGVWTDVWLSDKYPVAARVGVWRKGFREPTWGIAKWAEYFPSNEREQFMWKKMPTSQLAKCAEAISLRKVFPEDLGGMYIEEEMQQAEGPSYIPPTVGAAKEALAWKPTTNTPANTSTTSPTASPTSNKNGSTTTPTAKRADQVPPTGGPVTAEQIKLIHVLKGEVGGLTEEAYRKGLAVYRQANGERCVDADGKGTSTLLSRDQADHLIARFRAKIEQQGKRAARGLDPDQPPAPPPAPTPTLGSLMDKWFPLDGAGDEEGRAFLRNYFNVESTQQLGKDEVDAAIQLLLVRGTDLEDETETKLRALGRIR